jgi:hypothetical protein
MTCIERKINHRWHEFLSKVNSNSETKKTFKIFILVWTIAHTASLLPYYNELWRTYEVTKTPFTIENFYHYLYNLSSIEILQKHPYSLIILQMNGASLRNGLVTG